MSTIDYVIDILLILVIFRQVRPHELTPRAAWLPLVLLAVAGLVYLRPFTVRGNDLALIVLLAATGVVLGALSGLGDQIWWDDRRRLMSRAGVISVITWIAGMGFRFGFAYYAYHGGASSVAAFSARHGITGANVWTTALVMMAFGQVLARVGVLQGRRVRAVSQPASSPHVPAGPPERDASQRL